MAPFCGSAQLLAFYVAPDPDTDLDSDAAFQIRIRLTKVIQSPALACVFFVFTIAK
jgi:hypothetical protein